MAVTVSTRGRTKVKRVVVGKPIRRINTSAASGQLATLGGVNIEGAVDGSTLVYNASSGDFEATVDLDKQDVNGGQY